MTDIAARFGELLQHIEIPFPWDREAFVAAVAQRRGRPIYLRSVDDLSVLDGLGCGTTTSGLWVKTTDSDIVLYSAATEWHADHVIAHEIGHILLGHDEVRTSAAIEDLPAARLPLHALMPALSPDAIKSVLGRRDYSDERETAAETFADLLMVEATLPRRRPSVARRTLFRTRHR